MRWLSGRHGGVCAPRRLKIPGLLDPLVGYPLGGPRTPVCSSPPSHLFLRQLSGVQTLLYPKFIPIGGTYATTAINLKLEHRAATYRGSPAPLCVPDEQQYPERGTTESVDSRPLVRPCCTHLFPGTGGGRASAAQQEYQ